jgi:hypothetical protein
MLNFICHYFGSMLYTAFRLGLKAMNLDNVTIFVVTFDVIACFLEILTIALIPVNHDD